jgi:hypothetical protein
VHIVFNHSAKNVCTATIHTFYQLHCQGRVYHYRVYHCRVYHSLVCTTALCVPMPCVYQCRVCTIAVCTIALCVPMPCAPLPCAYQCRVCTNAVCVPLPRTLLTHSRSRCPGLLCMQASQLSINHKGALATLRIDAATVSTVIQ